MDNLLHTENKLQSHRVLLYDSPPPANAFHDECFVNNQSFLEVLSINQAVVHQTHQRQEANGLHCVQFLLQAAFDGLQSPVNLHALGRSKALLGKRLLRTTPKPLPCFFQIWFALTLSKHVIATELLLTKILEHFLNHISLLASWVCNVAEMKSRDQSLSSLLYCITWHSNKISHTSVICKDFLKKKGQLQRVLLKEWNSIPQATATPVMSILCWATALYEANDGQTHYWSFWTWTNKPLCVLPSIARGVLFGNFHFNSQHSQIKSNSSINSYG